MDSVEQLLRNLGFSGYYADTNIGDINLDSQYKNQDISNYISPDQYTNMQLQDSLRRAESPLVFNPNIAMSNDFTGQYYGGNISTGLPFLNGYLSGNLRGAGQTETINEPNYKQTTVNPLAVTGGGVQYEQDNWGTNIDYDRSNPDNKQLWARIFGTF